MKKQRVLVLMRAGASIGFNAPSTAGLTKSIEERILADDFAQRYKVDCVWLKIKNALTNYYKEKLSECSCQDLINFEHIYHCAHELVSTFGLTLPDAVGYGPDDLGNLRGTAAIKYRPVLAPFIDCHINTTKQSLQILISRIINSIQEEISTACNTPNENLDPLKRFIGKLQENYITRIYTTNYDNFILQASPDLYTGFSINHESGSKRFDRQGFWMQFNRNSVFHLHGSVHLRFGSPAQSSVGIGDFCWYENLHNASKHNSSVSNMRNMDGGSTIRTPIITGLDKLSSLQQMPFSYYYSCLSRDAMAADVIYVIGYGLDDLHINTWLKEVRWWRDPKPSLLFISRWKESFKDVLNKPACCFSPSERSKEQEMIHNLYTLRFEKDKYSQHGDWHFVKKYDCKFWNYAIWDKNFLEFLNAPDQSDSILRRLM